MDLPYPWVLMESEKYRGRCYYYNSDTQQCTWIRPIPYPGNHLIWPPLIYVLVIVVIHNQCENAVVRPDCNIRSKETALQKARKLIHKLIHSESTFEELARIESDHVSKSDGGVLGWIKRGVLPAETEELAWKLSIGEMTPPIDTKEGIYIILRRG